MENRKLSGALVKKYRKRAGVRQVELARQMGYQSSQFISNFERNLATVPPKGARKLCSILGIPVGKMKRAIITDRVREIKKAFG